MNDRSDRWVVRAGARPLGRREAIRLGLLGSALAFLGPTCQEGPRTPEPPDPPATEPVYELTSGFALYDDFDGHGNLQSYDGLDLATPGSLNPKLWVPDITARIVEARLSPNHALELSCGPKITAMAWLNSPREITFADFGSFGADVMLSSRTTAAHASATVNFHTTVPEQPPGRSWYVALGVFKDPNTPGGASVIGQYLNLNLGIVQNDYLGPALLDEWRTVRLDIVTRADDPQLGDHDLRLDYYLDGSLRVSRIPEDSAILIDPSRTGLGPHRSLIVNRDSYTGESVGGFDNVRARYRDRIA